MNYRLVFRVTGLILLIEAALLLLPCGIALIYRENDVFCFLQPLIISIAAGLPLSRIPVKQKAMFAREGFVIVALSWVLFSLIGCLPFIISGAIPSFVDAFFETVSGFTTTGASILTDVESLSYSLKFWRCFTNWIGGMGILVFMLALTPLTGGSSVHILRAESTGPTVEKMTPKLSTTAKRLYFIYVGITLLQIVLLAFDMPLFDAVVNSLATAGTGGFSIFNDSIGHYSAYSQVIIGIFMYLFGINFSLYYLAIIGKPIQSLKNEELRVFGALVLFSVSVITGDLMLHGVFDSFGETLRHSFFQVGTIISTTGFATTDFNLWPEFSKALMVLLMFFGSCAGSTAGGMKISRIIIAFKAVLHDLHALIHPRSVKSVRLNGKVVSEDVVNRTVKFLLCYLMLFAVSVLVVSLDGKSFTTNFTAVAATLNNIGPGLDVVGPTGNFSSFSVLSKIVLTLDMLIGRLEVFPMLILLSPRTWKGR